MAKAKIGDTVKVHYVGKLDDGTIFDTTINGSPSESFGIEEFYRRVAQREGVDYPEAVHHARAVISVVRNAVTAGELDAVREQLPDEYDDLLRADVKGTT